MTSKVNNDADVFKCQGVLYCKSICEGAAVNKEKCKKVLPCTAVSLPEVHGQRGSAFALQYHSISIAAHAVASQNSQKPTLQVCSFLQKK
jgi:hypothetical protein